MIQVINDPSNNRGRIEIEIAIGIEIYDVLMSMKNKMIQYLKTTEFSRRF